MGMDIEQFHSLCINHAQRYYDLNQFMVATCFALKPDGDVIMLCRQFDGYDEKQYVFNMYATILLAEKVNMYCFMSEAWFYMEKIENEVFDENKVVPASEHPDKKSCLFIVSHDKKNKQLSNMFIITNDKPRKLLIDRPLEGDYTDNVDLFNRIKTSRDPKINDSLNMLLKLSKPDWFNIVPKENFCDVKVDS